MNSARDERRRAPPARVALAILALTLAACGDIPQPFRHDGAAPRLARPKMERGITIRPLAGYEHAAPLAAALAKAMEAREIPSLVRTGPAFGHVIEGVAEEGGIVAWSLKGPDGAEAATLRQRLPETADPARLKRAATEAVAVLAQPLSIDPDAIPRQVSGAARAALPSARLVALAGLPGDGDKALNGAIRAALSRAGMTLGDDGDYIVQGAVTVTPLTSTEDNVLVVWTVKHAQDGSPIASIDQGGAVPRGRLALPWGALARDIAEGGAAGIAQAVRHAQTQPKPQPQAQPEPQPHSQVQPPPDPTMFTEPRPADIRAQDSSEQQKEARSTDQPAPAMMPPPPPRPSPAKTVTAVTPVKVKAVAGNRAKAITKPVPSSRIKRAQR